MTTITKANFTSKLAAFQKAGLSIRDTAQELIEFGLRQYGVETNDKGEFHGDTGYLNRVIEAAGAIKTLPTNTLKDYIKAHANLMFVKADDGSRVFKKVSKSAPIEVTIPTVKWYDWSGNKANDAKTDMDVTQQLNALRGRLEKAIKNGKTIKDAGITEAVSGLMSIIKGLHKEEKEETLAPIPEQQAA